METDVCFVYPCLRLRIKSRALQQSIYFENLQRQAHHIKHCLCVQNALPKEIDSQPEAAAPSVPERPKQGTALKSNRSYLQPKKQGHVRVSDAPPTDIDLPPKPVNKGTLILRHPERRGPSLVSPLDKAEA